MAGLNGKVIKRAYIHRYCNLVYPEELVDENGMELKPQYLRYFMVLDQNGFAYIIPAKYDGQNYFKCYEPEDIVEAALGNTEKVKSIEEVHEQIRQAFCNCSVLTDEWIHQAFLDTLNVFAEQYNTRLKEWNFPVLSREDFPTAEKTYKNFTKEELEIILANAIYPPTPKSSPFLGN